MSDALRHSGSSDVPITTSVTHPVLLPSNLSSPTVFASSLTASSPNFANVKFTGFGSPSCALFQQLPSSLTASPMLPANVRASAGVAIAVSEAPTGISQVAGDSSQARGIPSTQPAVGPDSQSSANAPVPTLRWAF